ncbi:MAG TPA: hypothetical protein VKP11_06240, partial [Frankiaceae bacterium]|nr:hypothetical protein [Frankiaceae bacterium]
MSSLRTRLAPLAVPLLAAAVASCAAGTDAQTQEQRTTVSSVGGAKGTITVRNVYVVGPAAQGGSTPVAAALFNGGNDDDTLAAV